MPVAPQSSAKSPSGGREKPGTTVARPVLALPPSGPWPSGWTPSSAPTTSARDARALKKDLKAGRAQIHGLLLDPPEYLLTAKVFDLLLSVPKYGRVKVNRILTHCRISPSKTIGGLSERQRNELVSYLRR